jgi:hypothetical protein
VEDGRGGSNWAEAPLVVANLPPGVTAAEVAPAQAGQSFTAKLADFRDPGVLDTHTALIDWGDGDSSSGLVTEAGGRGSVTGEHTYRAPGSYEARVTVTDDDGGWAAATLTIEVTGGLDDVLAPKSEAKVTPAANAAGWNNTEVEVEFSATDEEGGSGVAYLTYSATGAEPTAETRVEADTARLPIGAEGETTVTYFATDLAGNQETPQSLVVKIDRTAPSLLLSASPATLWPPQHQMVKVKVSVRYADTLAGGCRAKLVSVESSEPDNGLGDGDQPNDIQDWAVGTLDVEGRLRAERQGMGPGRLYTFTYQATDAAGNTVEESTKVTVPRDLNPRVSWSRQLES